MNPTPTQICDLFLDQMTASGHVALDPHAYTTREGIYTLYLNWCIHTARKPLTRRTFSGALRWTKLWNTDGPVYPETEGKEIHNLRVFWKNPIGQKF